LRRQPASPHASERIRHHRGQPPSKDGAYRSDLRRSRAQRRTRTIFTLTKTTPGQDHRPARTPTARRPPTGDANAPKPEPLRRHPNPLSSARPKKASFGRPSGGFPPLVCFAAQLRAPPATGGNGGDRVRTDDPLLAKQVLSQLSYTPSGPNQIVIRSCRRHRPPGDFLLWSASQPNCRLRLQPEEMGQGGFEPPTPRLSSVCSNQLSY
jgi:hypothetical protein